MAAIEEGIHRGHRARMRAKLLAHGAKIFDSYELLEMLLYYAIPYKDTNPIAKALLSEFGSLSGVFSARREELMRIPNVGPQVADFLIEVSALYGLLGYDIVREGFTVYDDYDKIGEELVRFFKANTKTNIAIMLFDNAMRLIKTEGIPGESFGRGSVLPKYFIDAALLNAASVAVVGYTHRNGLTLAFDGDFVTGRLIKEELLGVGVVLVEQYIVGGDNYLGITAGVSKYPDASPALERFFETRRAVR